MENQRSHLNTLPSPFPLIPLIHKRRMQCPPRPPIRLRIKILHQHSLRRTLFVQVVPPMTLPRLDRKAPSRIIGTNELYGEEIAIWDGPRVRDR